MTVVEEWVLQWWGLTSIHSHSPHSHFSSIIVNSNHDKDCLAPILHSPWRIWPNMSAQQQCSPPLFSTVEASHDGAAPVMILIGAHPVSVALVMGFSNSSTKETTFSVVVVVVRDCISCIMFCTSTMAMVTRSYDRWERGGVVLWCDTTTSQFGSRHLSSIIHTVEYVHWYTDWTLNLYVYIILHIVSGQLLFYLWVSGQPQVGVWTPTPSDCLTIRHNNNFPLPLSLLHTDSTWHTPHSLFRANNTNIIIDHYY